MSDKYRAFKYHDFRLLWIGQGISLIGTQMQLVGQNWHIYLLTKSAVALGILGLVRFLPMIVFGLIGGSFADAHNRKKLMIATQLSMAVLSFFLMMVTLRGQVSPAIIYAVSILTAIANSFDLPARQALIPNLVDRKDLAGAISLNNIMYYLSAIAGPAIAGLVIGHFGVGMVYLVNTVSFLGVFGALLLMKTSGDIEKKSAVPASISSIIDGMRFVRGKTIIWSTMLLDFFSTFFATASALLPIFAQTILTVGPVGLGLLYAAESIGAVITTAVVAHMGVMKKQGKVLLISVVVYAIGTIIFGASRSFFLCFVGLLIVGAGDSVSAVIRNNVRQLATPDHLRGRMTAVNMIFYMGGPQLGEFEAGLLAAVIGAPWAVVIGGIGTIAVVGIMAATIPILRNYQNEEEIV